MMFYYMVGVLLVVLLMAKIHSNLFGYICPSCDKQFEISTVTNARSPHLFRVTYLRCPHCGKLSWCRDISKKSTDWID